MKKHLLIISLLIATPVLAASWQELNNNGKTLYLDTQSITQNEDGIYSYWVKFTKNEDTYKILMKCDCSTNSSGVQKTMRYSSEGKLLENNEVSADLAPITPDSDAEKTYQLVCKKHKINKGIGTGVNMLRNITGY